MPSRSRVLFTIQYDIGRSSKTASSLPRPPQQKTNPNPFHVHVGADPPLGLQELLVIIKKTTFPSYTWNYIKYTSLRSAVLLYQTQISLSSENRWSSNTWGLSRRRRGQKQQIDVHRGGSALSFQTCLVGPLVTDWPTTAYSERFPFLIRQRTPRYATVLTNGNLTISQESDAKLNPAVLLAHRSKFVELRQPDTFSGFRRQEKTSDVSR